MLFLAAAFEELGWCGYAYDSLQSRFNLIWASTTFSLLWSLWHIPLIFVKDSNQWEFARGSYWFAVNFFLSIVPMGVILSWFCIKNGKSVPAAIPFHFIINISQEALAITQISIGSGLGHTHPQVLALPEERRRRRSLILGYDAESAPPSA